MHPGDVLQRAVGRHLQPQPHHLIDVLPLPLPQHLSIAGAAGALCRLRLRQEGEIPRRVKGQLLPFGGKKHLQKRQEKHRPGVIGRRGLLLREQLPPGKVIGKAQPPVLRLPAGKLRQLRAAQLQHVAAAQPGAVVKGCKALDVVLALQPLQQGLAAEILRRRAAGEPPQQGRVHLSDAFSVHGVTSRRMDAVFSIMPQFPSVFQGAAGIFSQKAAPPASKHTPPWPRKKPRRVCRPQAAKK